MCGLRLIDLAGADGAARAGEGAEDLQNRLEVLYAAILRLKIPGILPGWCLLLFEKSERVQALAQGLAAKIPLAAEAIEAAGANAAARHKDLADTTRDMGHSAPAEASYHDE